MQWFSLRPAIVLTVVGIFTMTGCGGGVSTAPVAGASSPASGIVSVQSLQILNGQPVSSGGGSVYPLVQTTATVSGQSQPVDTVFYGTTDPSGNPSTIAEFVLQTVGPNSPTMHGFLDGIGRILRVQDDVDGSAIVVQYNGTAFALVQVVDKAGSVRGQATLAVPSVNTQAARRTKQSVFTNAGSVVEVAGAYLGWIASATGEFAPVGGASLAATGIVSLNQSLYGSILLDAGQGLLAGVGTIPQSSSLLGTTGDANALAWLDPTTTEPAVGASLSAVAIVPTAAPTATTAGIPTALPTTTPAGIPSASSTSTPAGIPSGLPTAAATSTPTST